MNNKLLNEYPLIILPTLAVSIGLNNSIVLQQIWYWQNMKKMGKEADGRKWIRNSIIEWRDDNFPFWNERTIRRILTSLEKDGLIDCRSDLNDSPSNRTKWYSVNRSHVDKLSGSTNRTICPVDHVDKLSGSIYTETTKTETTSESITVSENEPIEKHGVDSESATTSPSENTEGHPPQVDLSVDDEKQIRSEMRNAYCWMMNGHSDLSSLSGKEIIAINSEIARIRKNTRQYNAEHMRRWWADIWATEWFNKGRTVTTYQQATMSQIRNGMSQAWEAMNNIEIEIIESSSSTPIVMNSQMAEQFLGGEYAS